MSTLYVRDVPDDVARTLKERAAAQGRSLSAYVVDELQRIADRPTNAEIAARLRRVLRDNDPSTEDIIKTLNATRR